MIVRMLGAYGEGKSTLAKRISDVYNLKLLPEFARVILQEYEPAISSFEQLRLNPDLVNEYQLKVFTKQLEEETKAGDEFVSPRAIDNVIFLARHGSNLDELIKTDMFKKYVDMMNESINFYLLPHKDLIKDDGVRDTNYIQAIELSGMVRYILESNGIKYMPIETKSPKDREIIVYGILNMYRELEAHL
jgi:dephospho-CoA kinase